jgi:antibiotic biosynthesis monooxygenase (ABM) superfamily enzyme
VICRVWRGWTTPENAAPYQSILLLKVIPAIEARRIPGFRHIDVLRLDRGKETEFTTLMWFDSIDSVRNFMGADYTVSHVPAEARAVLAHFDAHAEHHEAVDRRTQVQVAQTEVS